MEGRTDARDELPPGYRVRPPKVEEAGEVERVAAASDAALDALPTLSEAVIRYFWTRPRFVLERDAWVVEREGTIVGYGQVREEAPGRLSAFAVVHPDHVGLGLGTLLAATYERRAGEKASGEARLLSLISSQDDAAARLLAGRGYGFARRFWHMEVDLDGESAPPAPPPGVELRNLDPERDLPAAHRVLEEAFEDHWDHTPTPYEEFLEAEVQHEGFDPGLWVLAVEGEESVGVLAGDIDEDRGWVQQLGVLRTHRGRGIATALLRESFVRFRERGVSAVRLSVDSESPTGAVSLYERVGMRAVTSYDVWVRSFLGHGP
jgi:mycothiol synthase